MVRKSAIRFAEQRDRLKAETPIDPHSDVPPHPVASVHHHLPPNRSRAYALHHIIDIGPCHIGLFNCTRPGPEITCFSDLADFLDLFAVNRHLPQAYLETVICRGVMASCDLNTSVQTEMMDREIEDGRRRHADVHNLKARFHQCPGKP